MSAICRFCGGEFANAQAVRAHLKGCAVYQDRPARQMADVGASRQGSLGEASLGAPSLGKDRAGGAAASDEAFDPVRRLEQEIAAERLRLQLREVKQAHEEMDRRAEAAAQARRQAEQQQAEAQRNAERERETARRQAEHQKAEQTRRQEAETKRRAERRTIIQNVKAAAMQRRWISSADLRAQALQDVETALSSLAVEELPQAELSQIADGICAKIQESERAAALADMQGQLATLTRSTRRTQLAQHGRNFAERELRAVDGLSSFERARIAGRVADALTDLTGDETNAAVEARVEAVLEREGLGWEDEDGES
ncbi:MAG TPA: hypothetical protein VG735_03935 [Caulobacterales bacterium]|nr:hypothetical protein [Caulobacterales bacterium]